MNDGFEFTIRIKTCSECPHVEDRLYGLDCNLNNGDWGFRDMDGVGISPDCPYRNRSNNNSL
jgi:hypothetical protein